MTVGLFSVVIGMRTVTEEIRYETIGHAFLTDPMRIRTLGAKALVGAAVATVFAGASLAAMLAITIPIAAAKNGSMVLAAPDVSASIGFLVANALWAVVGVGIAAVIRAPVTAIVSAVVWTLVVETLGASYLGEAAAYLPGHVAQALARVVTGDPVLEVGAAATVMAFYAAGALVLGLLVTRARDVA